MINRQMLTNRLNYVKIGSEIIFHKDRLRIHGNRFNPSKYGSMEKN